MLIAEAEKAAEALEIAAKKSPLAQASLMESRMLIAEANQLIESIEIEEDAIISFENDNDLSENSTEPVPNLEKEMDADAQNLEVVKHGKVNGVHCISASLTETDDFSFDKFVLPDLVNGNGSSPCSNDILDAEENIHQTSSNGFLSPELDSTVNYSNSTKNLDDPKPTPNGISLHTQKASVNGLELQSENAEAPKKQVNIIKKWVRGRLVEVAEEA